VQRKKYIRNGLSKWRLGGLGPGRILFSGGGEDMKTRLVLAVLAALAASASYGALGEVLAS
jgi:hypothetical protein